MIPINKRGNMMKKFILFLSVISFSGLMLEAAPRARRIKTPNPIPAPIVINHLDNCFSPQEKCDLKLIAFMNQAKTSMDIAVYSITHPKIVEAIIAAHSRGVVVRMVVDRKQYTEGINSLVDSLITANIPLRISAGAKSMHHKFVIIDKEKLETGSFNYTTNASKNNAENQIYIFDKTVVDRFAAEFENVNEKARIYQEKLDQQALTAADEEVDAASEKETE